MQADAITRQLQQYLELGLSPIPLQGKVANYPWKLFELTEERMRKGIQAKVNWGLRAGFISPRVYLYFVDLDTKSAIGDFWKSNHLPPGTPIVSTGRGFHFYLCWKEEARTRHFAGMDIIGNGYVVAPPSTHANGKKYCFIVPLGSCIPMMDPELVVNPIPAETSRSAPNRPNSLAQHTKGQASFDWGSIWHGVPKGSRHNTLIRYLGILHARWHTQNEALVKALEWNLLNRPPLHEHEVEGAVRAAWTEWNRRKEDWYDHQFPMR